MPRQNREEFIADLAAAKLEGFDECRALVERLAEAGLSLKVANYALGERREELETERAELLSKAQASRAPAKPAPRRRRAATPAPEPVPDPPATVEPAVEAPTSEAAAEPLALVEPDEAPPSPSASTELPPESIPSDPSNDDDMPF